MKTFLICPVRGHAADKFADIVSGLEAAGWDVHWPPRDTDQDDDTGLRICTDNLSAIRASDAVHVVWDGDSQGCLFDLGAAFALGKRVIPISLPNPTEGKSFQNMIRAWAMSDLVNREDVLRVVEKRITDVRGYFDRAGTNASRAAFGAASAELKDVLADIRALPTAKGEESNDD